MRCLLCALFVATSLVGCDPNLEGSAAPPGDVAAFDPFAHIAAVAAFAGPEARLVSIDATGVRSDGTVPIAGDETTRVDHVFVSKEEGKLVEVRVEIVKPQEYLQSASDGQTSKMHLGMRRTVSPLNSFSGPAMEGRATELPTCRGAALWKQAIAEGAKKDSEGRITYDASGYELRASLPMHFSRKFDRDCKLLRK